MLGQCVDVPCAVVFYETGKGQEWATCRYAPSFVLGDDKLPAAMRLLINQTV